MISSDNSRLQAFLDKEVKNGKISLGRLLEAAGKGLCTEDEAYDLCSELRDSGIEVTEDMSDDAQIVDVSGIPAEYIAVMEQYPLLSAEEELELAKKAGEGSKTARDRMILSNLRLVISIAGKFKGSGAPLRDLIQAGNEGLIKAVDGFDWTKGFRFSTYATRWIRSAVMDWIGQNSEINVSRYMNARISKYKKTVAQLTQQFGRDPSMREIAKAMDVSMDAVHEIREAMELQKTGSSDDPQHGDDDDETRADYIADPDSSSFTEEKPELPGLSDEELAGVFSQMTELEEKIVRMRIGLPEDRRSRNGAKPCSAAEAARALGIGEKYYAPLERKAMEHFRSLCTLELGDLMDIDR